MMTTTHALVGALVGAAVAPFAPATTPAVVAAGFAGGAAPDADLVATHRRSTHFPVAGTAAATGLAGVAVAVASPATTLLAVFAVAVAIHCLMDALAGGVERRPWKATSEEAVYNHVGGYWVRPRRWVRYAGAPEDLLLATGAALPLLATTTGRIRAVVACVLAVSAGFVAVRRRLPAVIDRLLAGAEWPRDGSV